MTVLLAVVVKPNPETGISPYILMGSDSLRIDADDDLSNQRRYEDARKVFRVNDKLISMSGRVNSNFHDGFIEFIRENDCEITDLADLTLAHIKQHMSENELYEDAKFAVFIGSCIDANPKIALIQVNKNNLENTTHNIMQLSSYGFAPLPAGSISITRDNDLIQTFKERVGANLNLSNVEQAAREYLMRAASRYPETCNQNTKIEIVS